MPRGCAAVNILVHVAAGGWIPDRPESCCMRNAFWLSVAYACPGYVLVNNRIIWYYLVLCGPLWYAVVLCGIMWYSVVVCGITWQSVVLVGIIWYCSVLSGIVEVSGMCCVVLCGML